MSVFTPTLNKQSDYSQIRELSALLKPWLEQWYVKGLISVCINSWTPKGISMTIDTWKGVGVQKEHLPAAVTLLTEIDKFGMYV